MTRKRLMHSVASLALLALSLGLGSVPVLAQDDPTDGHAIQLLALGQTTADLEQALAFYQNGLGMTVLTRLELESATEVILSFDPTGRSGIIMLLESNDPQLRLPPPPGGMFDKMVLRVTDLIAVHANLTEQGYAPTPIRTHEGSGSTLFFVTDPDGHRLEITQIPADHRSAA